MAYPHDAYDQGLFGTNPAIKRAYWSIAERPYLQRCDVIVVSAPSHVDLLQRAGIRTSVLVARRQVSLLQRSPLPAMP